MSSNLAAPTKGFVFSILLYQTGGARRQSAPVSGAVDRLATLDSIELVSSTHTQHRHVGLPISTFLTTTGWGGPLA